MKLRASADRLREAIGRAGAMAVILGANSETASRAVGRTEPDVHLIKQVEHVTTSALEGPVWRFAGIPSMGGHGRGRNPFISDLAITALAVIWLQKSQNSPKRPGDLLAKGQSGDPVRYRFLTKGELTSRRG
jgi:hypothetical protein